MAKSSIALFALLLLLTPFSEISSIFDGFVWGPYYFVLSIGSVIAFLVSLFLFFRKKPLVCNINNTEAILLISLLYIGIRLLFTPYFEAYMHQYAILVVAVLVVFVFKRVFFMPENRRIIQAFILLLLSTGIVEGALGLWQLKGVYFNQLSSLTIAGTFQNRGIYANYLTIAGLFAWGIFLFAKPTFKSNTWIRYFALGAISLTILVLPFTEARTAWLAFSAGMAFLTWPLIRLKISALLTSRRSRIISFAALGLILVSALFFLFQFKEESAKGRLLIYKVSLNMIQPKPLFGYGFGRFSAEYNNFQAEYFKDNPTNEEALLADNVTTGFNEFLQTTVELGFAGLLLLIGLLLIIFGSKSKSEYAYLSYSAKGALIGTFVCSLFSYPLRVLPLAILVVFLLSIVNATDTEEGFDFVIGKWVFRPFFLILLCGVSVDFYAVRKDYQARIQWQNAMNFANKKEYSNALPCYQKAYTGLKHDGYFMYNYGSELLENDVVKGVKILEEAKNYLNDNDLNVYLGNGYFALKNYEKAEECYLLSSNMVPCKFYPRYQLFKLYCETYHFDKSKVVAQTIEKMNVKIPSKTVSTIKKEVHQWLLKNE